MTTLFDSQAFLKQSPTQPGVYKMLGVEDEVLYVGKAKNLKKRLTSYFQKNHELVKTQLLVQKIQKIEVIITASETEALLLENNLIKRYKPRFNVIFRDDKSYPYLYIATQQDFPRMEFHRGAQKAGGRHFGPYPSSHAVRENLQLLQKIFKLRDCRDHFFLNRTRPCLQYQIKRCTAPCVGYISQADYAEDVKNAILFLEGKSQAIIEKLINKMEEASQTLDFERAAKFRNQITSLRKLQEKQGVVNTHDKEMDVMVVVQQHALTGVQVLMIRGGLLIGNKTYFPRVPLTATLPDIAAAFLSQYYLNSPERKIPTKILINVAMKDRRELSNVFSLQAKQKISILHAARGERARFLEMALRNAKQSLSLQLADKSNNYQRFLQLQQALKLIDLPKKMACFDISHTLGEETVASYVVYTQEGAQKNEYRRYLIQDITPGDDYGAMKQAITRRFSQMLLENRPDVVLIDGGLGQLHQAEAVFRVLNIQGVLLLGVAKGKARKSGKETLWLSGQSEPVEVDPTSLAFHLIQHVRDEAHRFAITGHRLRREKKRVTSELEHIPGIGPKRRRDLLNYFGGWQEVKKASVEALMQVPGMSRALAEKIHAYRG